MEIMTPYSQSDFNPRSPYGERQSDPSMVGNPTLFQSTLPLRGATVNSHNFPFSHAISIHAPLTGSDLRKAAVRRPSVHFNPRSPYGERLLGTVDCSEASDFNPRSPYGERLDGEKRAMTNAQFQSTLPLRGATYAPALSVAHPLNFNPRSPYGERQKKCGSESVAGYFNPRSPYGERLCLHQLDQD